MELSYTMIQSFMKCEFSYYLRYVKRVPTLESSASAYGTAVHYTLKTGYDNDIDKDGWVKIFKQEWFAITSSRDLVFYSSSDFATKLKNGQELVADYYDKFVKGMPPPKATELRFGRKEGLTFGGHTLVGIIDQIDSNNQIIDYKTGAAPTQTELDLDLQFTIYSLAYRLLFGEDESSLVLRHLTTMRDLITSRVLGDFEVLEGEIKKLESKMATDSFLRNLGRDCANCYFLEACLGKEKKFNRWTSYKKKKKK